MDGDYERITRLLSASESDNQVILRAQRHSNRVFPQKGLVAYVSP